MRTLQFLGALIRHVDLRQKDTSDFIRIDLTAALTATLAKKLHIEEAQAGECFKRADLNIDEIPITELALSLPQEIAQHDLTLPAHALKDFVAVRHTTDEEVIEQELRFHAYLSGEHVAAVREYWHAIGEGKAMLTVKLAAEQAALPAAKKAAKGDGED